jgi:hypothetical protein
MAIDSEEAGWVAEAATVLKRNSQIVWTRSRPERHGAVRIDARMRIKRATRQRLAVGGRPQR